MTPKPPAQPSSDLPKLAAPALRALSGAGYTRLKQLTQVTEAELKQLHGMGPNALEKLRTALAAQGLSFQVAKAGQPGKDPKKTARKNQRNKSSPGGL